MTLERVRKKILLLGDRSPLTREWHRRLLRMSNWEIQVLGTGQNPVGRWDLVIHVVGLGVRHPDLERLQPTQPILHIVDPQVKNLVSNPLLSRSLLEDWVLGSSDGFEMTTRAERLMTLAGLQTEMKTFLEHDSKLSEFSSLVRSLDCGEVAHQAMSWFQRELGAKDVFWFSTGFLPKELQRLRERPEAVPQSASELLIRCTSLGDASVVQESMLRWRELPEFDMSRIVTLERADGLRDLIFAVRFGRESEFGHMAIIGVPELNADAMHLLEKHLEHLAQQMDLAFQYNELQFRTFKDDLTDLYNQRYLPVVLQQEMERFTRTQMPFSVLFVDVDFFKTVNDSNGHMVGSQVLVELSKLFKSGIRRTDHAFRYGGDEYVIVLTGAGAENAVMVAERLRKKTEITPFQVHGTEVNVTVSIGIASYPQHAKSTEELLHIADEAMYYGKNKSRNVVYLAS